MTPAPSLPAPPPPTVGRWGAQNSRTTWSCLGPRAPSPPSPRRPNLPVHRVQATTAQCRHRTNATVWCTARVSGAGAMPPLPPRPASDRRRHRRGSTARSNRASSPRDEIKRRPQESRTARAMTSNIGTPEVIYVVESNTSGLGPVARSLALRTMLVAAMTHQVSAAHSTGQWSASGECARVASIDREQVVVTSVCLGEAATQNCTRPVPKQSPASGTSVRVSGDASLTSDLGAESRQLLFLSMIPTAPYAITRTRCYWPGYSQNQCERMWPPLARLGATSVLWRQFRVASQSWPQVDRCSIDTLNAARMHRGAPTLVRAGQAGDVLRSLMIPVARPCRSNRYGVTGGASWIPPSAGVTPMSDLLPGGADRKRLSVSLPLFIQARRREARPPPCRRCGGASWWNGWRETFPVVATAAACVVERWRLPIPLGKCSCCHRAFTCYPPGFYSWTMVRLPCFPRLWRQHHHYTTANRWDAVVMGSEPATRSRRARPWGP